MDTLHRIDLTTAELNHLLAVFLDHINSGEYWGPKKEHAARKTRIVKKLNAAYLRQILDSPDGNP